MARGLKFRIKVVEGLYYPYSVNKGADQLCGYRTTDLRLCFRICKNPVFSRRGSNSGTCIFFFGEIKFVSIDVAIFDLVQDVEIIFHLH